MKLIASVCIAVLIISDGICQDNLESSLEKAFTNAKKGVYWALNNIPQKKASVENDLILDDILYSSVKLTKEFEGVKIVSKGFFLSNEIEIVTYKSFNNLIKEGYWKEEEEKIDVKDK